jgi:hypothetical protein
MSAGPPSALLLHGLHDATTDPFADLSMLEQDLIGMGLVPLRFPWPQGFNSVRALMDRRRSFSAELAAALDAYLRQEVGGRYGDGDWIVVAHSGSGLVWYRWLLEYGPAFRQTYGSLPRSTVIIAAPYQCMLQRIELPTRRIPVAEPAPDPHAIAGALPNRLVVVITQNDRTALAQDTTFPGDLVRAGQIRQYRIVGTGHRDVCHDARVRRLVAHHAR